MLSTGLSPSAQDANTRQQASINIAKRKVFLNLNFRYILRSPQNTVTVVVIQKNYNIRRREIQVLYYL